MSLNENPIILRQSFNKLWKNNIYLLEESDKGLQFLSVYKSNLRVNSILSYKYRKRVSNRVTRGENDLDLYTNYYKYRKNKKHKKKENPFTKKALDEALRKEYKLPEKVKLVRKKKYRYTLPARREKSALFQQLLQPFTEVTCGFFNRLPRLREPIRRLSFFRKGGVRK